VATFEQWDRKTRDVCGAVKILKHEVASVKNVTQRTKDNTFVVHSVVTLKDGQEINVSVPAGEVHDRLNDDTATAPEESLFKDF
jgi:hypothetical protein